jgi:hypothetical protein
MQFNKNKSASLYSFSGKQIIVEDLDAKTQKKHVSQELKPSTLRKLVTIGEEDENEDDDNVMTAKGPGGSEIHDFAKQAL